MILGSLFQNSISTCCLLLSNGSSARNQSSDGSKLSLVIGFLAGLVCTSLSIVIGIYAFDSNLDIQCHLGNYENYDVCYDCRTWLNPLCDECSDINTCTQCDRGYYAHDRLCKSCQLSFGAQCEVCTSDACTYCTSPYFLNSSGECAQCDNIPNCVSGACGEDGCTECLDGYYLENGLCHACSD